MGTIGPEDASACWVAGPIRRRGAQGAVRRVEGGGRWEESRAARCGLCVWCGALSEGMRGRAAILSVLCVSGANGGAPASGLRGPPARWPPGRGGGLPNRAGPPPAPSRTTLLTHDGHGRISVPGVGRSVPGRESGVRGGTCTCCTCVCVYMCALLSGRAGEQAAGQFMCMRAGGSRRLHDARRVTPPDPAAAFKAARRSAPTLPPPSPISATLHPRGSASPAHLSSSPPLCSAGVRGCDCVCVCACVLPRASPVPPWSRLPSAHLGRQTCRRPRQRMQAGESWARGPGPCLRTAGAVQASRLLLRAGLPSPTSPPPFLQPGGWPHPLIPSAWTSTTISTPGGLLQAGTAPLPTIHQRSQLPLSQCGGTSHSRPAPREHPSAGPGPGPGPGHATAARGIAD